MITLKINGYDFTPIFSTFPGGEEHVNILGNQTFPIYPATVTIVASLDSSIEIMRLLLVHDAILNLMPREIENNITLDLRYLPYARQDRVCEIGESFSIKVFCNLINSMEFREVLVTDPHSDVGPALLNNCKVTPQHKGFSLNPLTDAILCSSDVLIVPDLGAAKKSVDLAYKYDLKTVQCNKARLQGGWITVTAMQDWTEYADLNFVVADDICDGGGTFLALAKALNIPKERVSLVVTHGIFSKGKEALLEKFNKVEAVYDWTK